MDLVLSPREKIQAGEIFVPKILCINVPHVGTSGESVNVGHPDKKAIPEHSIIILRGSLICIF